MYLFNKICDFMAFLCRIGNVTPDSVQAHLARERPRPEGFGSPPWQTRLRRLLRG